MREIVTFVRLGPRAAVFPAEGRRPERFARYATLLGQRFNQATDGLLDRFVFGKRGHDLNFPVKERNANWTVADLLQRVFVICPGNPLSAKWSRTGASWSVDDTCG